MSKRKSDDPDQPGAKRLRSDKELKVAVEWKSEFYDSEPQLTGAVDSLSKQEGRRVKSWKPMQQKQPLPFLNHVESSEFFRIVTGDIREAVNDVIRGSVCGAMCMDEKRNPVKVYWNVVDDKGDCINECEIPNCKGECGTMYCCEEAKRETCLEDVLKDIEKGLTFCACADYWQFYIHKIGEAAYIFTRHDHGGVHPPAERS